MVCVPCFIIPVLLVIWRLFIQPIVLRFWNPWEKKDEKGNVIKSGKEFPFECIGGTCKFVSNKNKENQDGIIAEECNEAVDENPAELKKQQ